MSVQQAPQQQAVSARAAMRGARGAWHPVCIAVIVAALTAAFHPVLFNGFAADESAILDNPHLRGLAPAGLRWAATTWHTGRYQPLTWISLGLDRVCWGLRPAGYHLSGLLLHVANALLVYLLTRQLVLIATTHSQGKSRAGVSLPALAAALLWGLHPLRVDAVAWASQRAFPLSTLFALLCALLYVHGVSTRRWALVALALPAYLLSIAAGPFAVPLPIVLAVLQIYPLRLRREDRAMWLAPAPFAIVMVCVIAASVPHIGPHAASAEPGVLGRAAIVFHALGFHIWRALWPIELTPVYELAPTLTLVSTKYIASAAGVLAALALLVRFARRVPALVAAAVAYVALLLPVSGFIPLGANEVAERYGYLPSIAWAVLIGGGLGALWAAPRQALRCLGGGLTVACLLLAGWMALFTWRQCHVWRSPATLWAHVRACARPSGLAQYHYAVDLERAGMDERAAQVYDAAISLRSGLFDAHRRLIRVLIRMGDLEGAIRACNKAIRVFPDIALLHRDLGATLAAAGRLSDAERPLRRAIELSPGDASAWRALGHLFLLLDRVDEAVDAFMAGTRADPRSADAFFDLGRAYQRSSQPAAAAEAFRQALAIDPSHALARQALGLDGSAGPPSPAPPTPHAHFGHGIGGSGARAHTGGGLCLAGRGGFHTIGVLHEAGGDRCLLFGCDWAAWDWRLHSQARPWPISRRFPF